MRLSALRLFIFFVVGSILLFTVAPPVLSADDCSSDTSCAFNSCRTPAKPAPSNLWGELRPTDVGTISSDRDTTSFGEVGVFDSSHRYWHSVDIANGYVFTAINTGFEIWNANSNPAQPTRLTTVDGRAGTCFPAGSAGCFPQFGASPEHKYPVRDIAVPDGRDDLMALVADGSVGLTIWDATNKTNPRALYQDFGDGKSGTAAYAAELGGNAIAFMTGSSTGVTMYNMTRAKTNGVTCTESTPVTVCPGVYLGKIGSRQNVQYIHGYGTFVVFSSGAVQKGLEIWNVSTPTAPVQVMNALTSTTVYDSLIFNQGGTYYLATREDPGASLRIYDVSCITSGPCSPSLVTTVSLNESGNIQNFLTFSRSNGTPFLHVGSDSQCADATQHEWLFDVSNPAAPRDITPPGYWAWYARGTATGFNFAGMRRAKFWGAYLYRAAYSYMDIHQRTGGSTLNANFSWSPSEIYAGAAATFNDLSSGSPTSWNWTFQNGSPSSSTDRNPVVTFASPGTNLVSLQACNGGGCQSTNRNVTVLSAGANVTGVTLSKSAVTNCDTLTMTATGVTGQAPITYQWVILGANGIVAHDFCGSVNPCSWPVPSTLAGGSYNAGVWVTNPADPNGRSATAPFTLSVIPLSFPTGGPSNDAFTGSSVRFHANSSGATSWSWDFDDDGNPSTASFGAYSSDATNGPNPFHTYTSNGTKYVKVRIRDCTGTVLESNALVVNIAGTTLSAAFQAQGCQVNNCTFETGQLVTFTDSSGGSPTGWSYDWNNTGSTSASCTFGSAFSAPQTSHTWTSTGTYRPCLRVSSGAQTAIVVHAPVTITQAGPPGITITGPKSGWPATPMQFSATAHGCTPSSIWNWSAGDGVGATTSSVVNLQWSTAGWKQVTVTNSGCSGMTGTLPVYLTTQTSAPLNAAFTYSPSPVSIGQQVTFDGTSSTGGPNVFTWQITGPTNSGFVDGALLNYTFTAAGTYNVSLTISKPGSGAGCTLGSCSDIETKSITVSAATGGCAGDANSLCLGANGRFKVSTSWRTPAGQTGTGTPIRLTGDTGYFWFFNSSNVEMLVKALDGCGLGGNFWVFSAGLTNVEVTTTVTDTLTSRVKTYTNPQGVAFLPVQDTAAFTCSGSAKLASWATSLPVQTTAEKTIETFAPAATTCSTSGSDLCLNNGRFKVNANWQTPDGATGSGHAIQLTQDTGYFWFFSDSNVELITKVLDGCGINSAFWSFAAGLTNVKVDLSVTDLKSGVVAHYNNAQGAAFQPVQDTTTMNTCP